MKNSRPTRNRLRPQDEKQEHKRQVLRDNRARARQHETRIAKLLDGERTPASGALREPGDVMHPILRIENKSISGRKLQLDLKVVEKIDREAVSSERTPAIALEFVNIGSGVERDWIMMPARVVASLIRRV